MSLKLHKVHSIPLALIDPNLVKSTATPNKGNTSFHTEHFHQKTPNELDLDPLPTPLFTADPKPEKWDEKILKGEIDLTIPLKDLIQPKTDLLKTGEIEAWYYKNYSNLNTPAAYIGNEGNTDSPDLWDSSDIKALVVRLSPYDSVNGSMTHGAVAQMCHQAGREGGFQVFVDHAYMPGGQKDCRIFKESKIPWLFGRTTKRHPNDFDLILISTSLTLECVVGRSRLVTSNGLESLSSLEGKGGFLLTEYGPRRFDSVVKKGKRMVLQLKTAWGRSISVTESHLMKVIDGDGYLGWKKASSLKRGDYLLTKIGDSSLIPNSRGLDSDLWYLVGHLYGDGTRAINNKNGKAYKRAIWFTIDTEPEMRRKLKEILSKFKIPHWDYDATSIPDDDGIFLKERVGVLATEVMDWRDLEALLPLYRRQGKWKEFLPEKLWLQGKEQIFAFLRAIFSTDGKVDHTAPCFGTKFETLAQDVQKLLLSVGILSSIKVERKKDKKMGRVYLCYNLRVIGAESRRIFREEIGFEVSAKSLALENGNLSTHVPRKKARVIFPSDKFGIPKGPLFANSLPEGFENRPGIKFSSIKSTIRFLKKNLRKMIPHNRVVEITNFLSVSELEEVHGRFMRDYVEHNWCFDQVIAVEEGQEEDVYDVMDVEETSSFVADGFVVHNCWNIIPALIYSGVAPFHTMRQPEKKLTDKTGYPTVIMGGVVSDFVESLYGKVAGEECVVDATVIGDGEYTLPRILNLYRKCQQEGKTKAEFLRLGHDLPQDSDFERNSPMDFGKYSWWYQPYLYEHIYDEQPDPKTGYRELRDIVLKDGHDYAAKPGLLKRAVVRDLNKTSVWTDIILQYMGCDVGSSLVLTEDGIQKLQDLEDKESVIFTVQGPKIYQGIKSQGLRETIKFRTRLGNLLQVTPNHRFEVALSDGTWDWKEAKDLKVGDRILGKLGDDGMLPEFRGYEPDMWYLVGHLYGDGWRVGKGRKLNFLVAEGEEELQFPLKRIISGQGAKFGTLVQTAEEKNWSNRNILRKFAAKKYVWRLQTSEYQLPILGEILPTFEKKSGWRRGGVPKSLWKQGKQQIIAFLQGLFNTDGSVQWGQAELSTCHKQLARDVQQLLRYLGITARVSHYKSWDKNLQRWIRYWRLQITGTKAKFRFRERVGFTLSSKKLALEKDNISTHTPRREIKRIKAGDRFLGFLNAKNLAEELLPDNRTVFVQDRERREISSLIKWKGIHRRHLAFTIGMDPSSLTGFLNGRRNITRANFQKLKCVLDEGRVNAVSQVRGYRPVKEDQQYIPKSLYSLLCKVRAGGRGMIPDNVLQTLAAFIKQRRIKTSLQQRFLMFVDQDLYMDEIVKIENGGKELVYDPLSVEGLYSYVSNGINSHNSLGDSVDIQISCVVGSTLIETELGFETIEDTYNRLKGESFLIQTRHALQGAQCILCNGRKKVRKYEFCTEDGKYQLSIVCTGEHKFDTATFGDASPNWTKAKDLQIGQEVKGVNPESYQKMRDLAGKINDAAQHYYSEEVVFELHSIGPETEELVYDVLNSEVHEYIANGFHVHNSGCLSGGLCSFCLAAGTLVSLKGVQVPIESLEDFEFEGDPDEREFDTPWGLQVPKGVQYVGDKECLKLTTKGGTSLVCTPEHQLLTHKQGKVELVQAKDFVPNKDKLILISTITGKKPTRDDGSRDFLYPEMIGSRRQQKSARQEEEKIATAAKAAGQNAEQAVLEHTDTKKKETQEQQQWLMKLRKANAYDDLVVSVEPAGVHKVYDVWDIPRGHVFYANGIVVSNCSTGETEIVVADGSTRVITQVEIGDLVYTSNGSVAPVTGRYERDIDEEIILWQTERLQHPVRTTKNHKFPAVKAANYKINPTWEDIEEIPLGDLAEGDYLIGPESTPETPVLVKILKYQPVHYRGKVYNIEVGHNEHSYRIGYTDPPAEVKEILADLEDESLKAEVIALLQNQ